MDGNGRWAEAKGLHRLEGHRAGVETVRVIVTACAKMGLAYLTLYAFSLENWKRPRGEVSGLMGFLKHYLLGELPLMQKNNVRLRAIGRIGDLPAGVRQSLDQVIAATSANTGLTLILALNYGGRAEIMDGVRSAIRDSAAGRLQAEELTEERFSGYLYTAGIPDPDLVIRTSGELRVSNFLLWQISYAEFWSTPVCWPDFNRERLLEAIAEFNQRKRRYGGLKSIRNPRS
jgi:undecaprenyl diphosphate synthase